jgi:hypothetical protein
MHITNPPHKIAIKTEYTDSLTAVATDRWTFTTWRDYIRNKHGVNDTLLVEGIEDAIIKSIFAVESRISLVAEKLMGVESSR